MVHHFRSNLIYCKHLNTTNSFNLSSYFHSLYTRKWKCTALLSRYRRFYYQLTFLYDTSNLNWFWIYMDLQLLHITSKTNGKAIARVHVCFGRSSEYVLSWLRRYFFQFDHQFLLSYYVWLNLNLVFFLRKFILFVFDY
jgi:hypothetical protein